MKTIHELVVISAIMVAILLAAPRRTAARALAEQYASSQERSFVSDDAQDREQELKDRAQEKLERQQELYDRGQEAMERADWKKAAEIFNQIAQREMALADAKRGGTSVEGALYWKAYALNKQGQKAEALTTLAQLNKTYPQSRWVNDAKQLELEIKQGAGQTVSPESQSDDDLKLMALNGCMNSDPERCIPLLEKFLQGSQSLKLKERALFVLSQSGKPHAREIVANVAKGNSNPDLQMKALNDLGLFGGKDSRQTLADIYASSTDEHVKRAIMRSFMIGGDRDRLFALAKSEKSPELRREAIQQLALTGAQSELWQLYQAEPNVEVKGQILRSMFLAGNSDKLVEVARNEKDPTLREAAIHSLGLMGAGKAGGALASLYTNEKDIEVRRSILNSLFIQGNADALIDIARKEKDPELKKEAVQKLSLMGSPKATEFLMEILNK